MIKETRKTVIGGFVVGALALGITGIFVFGSGDFFKKKNTYVLFFEDSIKGLSIGAPVLFRGVQIGMVTDISIEADMDKMTTQIPVLIETESSQWKIVGHNKDIQIDDKMKEAIEIGLRASLELQSLVTGKYIIQLDFRPDEPAVFRDDYSQYQEIPTFRAGLSKLSQKLESLPIGELVEKLLSAVSGIDNIINSPDAKAVVPAIHGAITDIQQLIKNLDAQVDPLSSSYIQLARTADQNVRVVSTDISGTVKSYQTLARNLDKGVGGAVKDYQKLARDLDKEVGPLVAEIRMTAESIRGGLTTAESALANAKTVISNDSPVVLELTKTLKELSLAARSIRIMADYLERHPEALIKGKGAYRR